MMPGDLGDARLNNYFLENVYKVIMERQGSLWHLPLFYPWIYVGAFSDNLFGAAPVYIIARWITGEADTAFQLWFIVSYLVNFVACYYALRKMGATPLGASVGSLVFAFALPTSARYGHAQLSYRFGVPLATAALCQFFESGKLRFLVACLGWIVWQMFCSIYIGFFTILLLLGVVLARFAVDQQFRRMNVAEACRRVRRLGLKEKPPEMILLLAATAILVCALAFLFYPYWQVTTLYSFRRSVGEIASMLPRLESYCLSDISWMWNTISHTFSSVPMRWEHQMFFGLVPVCLGIVGLFAAAKPEVRQVRSILFGAFILMVLLTISVSGKSIWLLFCQFPLISAIRAVARIDVVLLFPLAFLVAVGVDALSRFTGRYGSTLAAAASLMFLIEAAAVSPTKTKKEEWRARISKKENLIPLELPTNSVLFFAQSMEQPFYAEELDAMWVSLKRGFPTLNGYSGNAPIGVDSVFGQDLSELPRRVLSWIAFSRPSVPEHEYFTMLSRIVPLGFVDAPKSFAWSSVMPTRTFTRNTYSPEELSNLSLRPLTVRMRGNECVVAVEIGNAGSKQISSISRTGHNLNLSWRFKDNEGVGIGGWDTRKPIPFDIPAGQSIHAEFTVGTVEKCLGKSIEVSIVQEEKFWLHDFGFVPLQISINPTL